MREIHCFYICYMYIFTTEMTKSTMMSSVALLSRLLLHESTTNTTGLVSSATGTHRRRWRRQTPRRRSRRPLQTGNCASLAARRNVRSGARRLLPNTQIRNWRKSNWVGCLRVVFLVTASALKHVLQKGRL